MRSAVVINGAVLAVALSVAVAGQGTSAANPPTSAVARSVVAPRALDADVKAAQAPRALAPRATTRSTPPSRTPALRAPALRSQSLRSQALRPPALRTQAVVPQALLTRTAAAPAGPPSTTAIGKRLIAELARSGAANRSSAVTIDGRGDVLRERVRVTA